jgi:hypothetical protein
MLPHGTQNLESPAGEIAVGPPAGGSSQPRLLVVSGGLMLTPSLLIEILRREPSSRRFSLRRSASAPVGVEGGATGAPAATSPA